MEIPVIALLGWAVALFINIVGMIVTYREQITPNSGVILTTITVLLWWDLYTSLAICILVLGVLYAGLVLVVFYIKK